MDSSSTNKQVRGVIDKSSPKAGVSGKRVTDVRTRVAMLTRKLRELQLELMFSFRRIEINLRRRENLIELVSIFMTTFERHLLSYQRAVEDRRKLRETFGDVPFDVDNVDFQSDASPERQNIVESIHDVQQRVAEAEQRIIYMQNMCATIEPLFKKKTAENERIHANLWEKFKAIERSRQQIVARRKQLLKSLKSTGALK